MPANEGLGDRDWGTGFSLRDVLTVVFKRRWIIIICTASVFAGAVFVSLLLPPSYEVAANLLVSRARAEVPLAPTDSAQAITSAVDEKELNSEVEVLKSRTLIEQALNVVGVDDRGSQQDGLLTRQVRGLRSAYHTALGIQLPPVPGRARQSETQVDEHAQRKADDYHQQRTHSRYPLYIESSVQ